MKDAEYVFYTDLKDKKSVARSAHKKRTHCGRGGRVRLPSDNLTKKELENMNGKLEVYRLNEPMSWEAFKAMPEEHQKTYLERLRRQFNVSDKHIAVHLFGIAQNVCNAYLRRRGLNSTARRNRYTVWDEAGWYAWLNGAEAAAAITEEAEEQEEAAQVTHLDPLAEEVAPAERQIADLDVTAENIDCFETVDEELPCVPFWETEAVPDFREEPVVPITPCSGTMSFEGKFEDVLKAVGILIGSASGKIHIAWDVA